MFNFKFALLPLLILSIGLSGCTKLNKDVSKTLSIVIEPAFKEQVLDAVKYATSKNNSLEFEIKILSPDPDKRSAEIQKLRTQIMSGKGPDLYLVNCSTDGAAQMNEPLFENPYKAMQSGVFASLDKYMKKDSRIEYFYKENGGIISARIAGIKRIKNKFVMLVDNDDILHSQCLEIFKLIMEKTDADMVMSELFQNMSKHGHFKIKKKYTVDDIGYEMIDMEKAKRGLLGEQNYTPTVWDKLYKSEVIINSLDDIETIPLKLKTGEDMCMNLCIYNRMHSIAMAHVKLYNYRYSNTFLNKTIDKMDEVVLFHKWRSWFIENENMNKEYHRLNLSHTYHLLLFYGFDNVQEKVDSIVEETEKYIDVDKDKYRVSGLNIKSTDSWMIKMKRWMLKNL